MENNKKIDFVEALLLFLFCLFVDIFEVVVALTSAIPVVGQALIIVNFFVDIIIWLGIQFYFIIKGERGLLYLAGSIAEFFPYIDMLPIRTVVLLIAIYMANHPKSTKLIKPLRGKSGKIKK